MLMIKRTMHVAAGTVLTACLLVVGAGAAQAKEPGLCGRAMEAHEVMPTRASFDLLYGEVDNFWFDSEFYVHNMQKMMQYNC